MVLRCTTDGPAKGAVLRMGHTANDHPVAKITNINSRTGISRTSSLRHSTSYAAGADGAMLWPPFG